MKLDRKTSRDDNRGTINTPRLGLTADTNQPPSWLAYDSSEYPFADVSDPAFPVLSEAEYEQRAGAQS